MDNFEDIRPYTPEEIPSAIEMLIGDEYFKKEVLDDEAVLESKVEKIVTPELLNTSYPISITVSGIIIDCKLLHLKNAYEPILDKFSDILIYLRFIHS
jgi:hypothetical protein